MHHSTKTQKISIRFLSTTICYMNDLLYSIKTECMKEKKLFSFETKKNMFNRINKFTSTEMMYIFQIIVSEGETYTRNKNGIFFDLNNLNDKTLNRIKEYIDIIQKSEEVINLSRNRDL